MSQNFIPEAECALSELDVKYNLADFSTKRKLKKERDGAYENWAGLRRGLLEKRVTLKDSDLKELQEIRNEISKAAQGQQLILASAKLTGFFVKLAA